MNKANDSHFKILGVNKYATSEEIKKAYWNLLKKNHPDIFPNVEDKDEATRKTQKLIEAYELITDYINQKKGTKFSTKNTDNSYSNQRTECDWQNRQNKS